MSDETHTCPHCAESCARESVHNGVAMIHGPWGCPSCGWSEWPEYDSREGVVRDGEDRVFDQFGVSHYVGKRSALNPADEGQ